MARHRVDDSVAVTGLRSREAQRGAVLVNELATGVAHHEGVAEAIEDSPQLLRLVLPGDLGLAPLGQIAVTLAKPIGSPPRSRTGEITTFAQKRDPSLRTRQPSSSNRPSLAALLKARAGICCSIASAG